MPLDENTAVVQQLAVYLPTGKTRDHEPPLRKFHLSLSEANRVEKYLEARRKFLSLFNDEYNSTSNAHASMLLTDEGKPLDEKSLTRDFARLAVSAGLGDVKLCQSMFRHRFITVEILLEMQNTIQSTAVASIWNEGIRHSICAVIAAKTGHLRAASLYTYFDEAYKFSTQFNTYNDAVHHLRLLDEKLETLTYRRHEIRKAQLSGQVNLEFAESTLKWLEEMQAEIEALKTIALKT